MLYGASQALRDYICKTNTRNLFYIGHPLLEQRSTILEEYKGKKQIRKTAIKRSLHFGIGDYIIDFLISFYLGLRYGGKETVYIGVDPLNCICGIILKKIGRVERVVFYTIDFVPVRFHNKTLNVLFHTLEKICVKTADENWDVSPRIAEGRAEFLGLFYTPKVVPIGIWNDNFTHIPFEKVKKNQLLFVGHLLEKQGVQEVLKAIPMVIEKVPTFLFVVVGGGEYEEQLKKQVKKLGVEKHVQFMGWVKNRTELENMMGESACAIAPYKPEGKNATNFTYYADPTKIKDYLGAGLPIILTDVSYNAKFLHNAKCGIIVSYNASAIADAIIKLMSNSAILKNYRQNARKLAKEYEWSTIFRNVLPL